MKFWERFLGFDPNRKTVFPGQQSEEEIELMTVFHWIILVPFFLQIFIIIGIFVFIYLVTDFFDQMSFETQFFVGTIILTLFIHIFCFRLYNHFMKVTIITNFRVIEIRNTVFLHREQDIISMNNIQDFRYEQKGILPRILKFGDLIIFGTNVEIKYELKNLPHVANIHHLLGEIYQKFQQNQMPSTLNTSPSPLKTEEPPQVV